MANGESDIYVGRMVCDGNGNLLADEGERAGQPIAYHDGSYIFIKPGEPSHNERHHVQFAQATPTQDVDPDLDGYAGTADAPTEGNEHHFAVVEDDPHYDADADNLTKLVQLPDAVSAKLGGHTDEAKTGGE